MVLKPWWARHHKSDFINRAGAEKQMGRLQEAIAEARQQYRAG